MIIESGADIHDLLFDGCELQLGELRVMALDADLRPRWIGTLTTAFRSRIEGRAVDMLENVLGTDPFRDTDRSIRFVAFAHAVREVDADDLRTRERLEKETTPRLTRVLARHGVTSLGVVICDGMYWTASNVTGSFSDSDVGDEVPRIAVVRGPHPIFSCECEICRHDASIQDV